MRALPIDPECVAEFGEAAFQSISTRWEDIRVRRASQSQFALQFGVWNRLHLPGQKRFSTFAGDLGIFSVLLRARQLIVPPARDDHELLLANLKSCDAHHCILPLHERAHHQIFLLPKRAYKRTYRISQAGGGRRGRRSGFFVFVFVCAGREEPGASPAASASGLRGFTRSRGRLLRAW